VSSSLLSPTPTAVVDLPLSLLSHTPTAAVDLLSSLLSPPQVRPLPLSLDSLPSSLPHPACISP
jgi:hypothetical protein